MAAATASAAWSARINIAFTPLNISSNYSSSSNNNNNSKCKNEVLHQGNFHGSLLRSPLSQSPSSSSLPNPPPSPPPSSSFSKFFSSSSTFKAMDFNDDNHIKSSSLYQETYGDTTTSSELIPDLTPLPLLYQLHPGHRQWKRFCMSLSSVAISASLILSPLSFDADAMAAESLTITFPASKIREVIAAQKTLIETWGLIRETYVDPTFNHQDWDSKLGETMSQILPEKTADAAYAKIQSMLATLGDPFTRLVSPQEYQKFKIGNDGALEGIGLLIASDRDSGRLVVISALDGGPAAKAGIQSGDELVQIDDEMLSGIDGEKAASKLRGPAGTLVKLKIRRDGLLKDPGNAELTEVKIFRESITLSPVFTAVLPHMTPDGHLVKTGYVRLTAFSQNAAADMEKAISGLETEGADSYILDLRNNPGGLVKAGLDVAQMWLDGSEILVNTIDRDGNTLPISLENNQALTHDPLAVLVNGGSASASEILAGALHDNGRAVLVGTKTYGKGKIQSVTELKDGSALFVTVAKYLSPSLHEIDQVGITPDVLCSSGDIAATNADSLKGASSTTSPIEQDSCIVAAEHQLGIF